MTPPPLGTSPPETTIHGGPVDGPSVTGSSDALARVDAPKRPPVPVRASGVELFGETPGSGYRKPPSLVRRADGQTVQLTPLLYAVLRAIDGTRDYHQIAANVSERIGRMAAAEDVYYLTESKLRPLGLLRNADGSEPEVKKANPLLALRCRLVITNPAVTRRITAPFAALFHPAVVLLFLVAFVWSTWWVAFEHGLASGFHQAFYEPHLLLLVFFLTLVSAGFHEFGHAAACRYGGATPGAMGFGLYLIWPAFYTDVTDSYRLGRGGRLRVDLGGLYFNAVFAVATFGAWAWFEADALLLLFVAQMLQMSRQLAPLVRFDGYHILADLTGIPDLFGHIKPTLLGFLPTRWGRGHEQALKPWARIVVTLWVITVVPLLLLILAMIVMILPRLAATAWDSLGIQWEVLGDNWADREFDHVALRMLSIIALALPVLTMTYLIARVTRRAALWLWRATAGSRSKRAAAALAAAAAIAAVAWAWWPQGQFRPIEPTERVVLSDMLGIGYLLDHDRRDEPSQAAATPSATARIPGPRAGMAEPPPAPPAQPAPPGATAAQPSIVVVLAPASERTETGVEQDAGPEAVPTSDAPEPPPDWPFPWNSPPPASEGDNRAMVVNLEDGSTVYDLAFAFVWVTDGGPVDERNEAFAYASCSGCTSLAVAFQVILIVGQVDVITPVNSAVAANYECESCRTQALAVQLVATLVGEPDDEVMYELGRIWAELELVEAYAEAMSIEEFYAWLKWIELRILAVLASADVDVNSAEADAVASAEGAETEDEPSPDTEPSGESCGADPTEEGATEATTAGGEEDRAEISCQEVEEPDHEPQSGDEPDPSKTQSSGEATEPDEPAEQADPEDGAGTEEGDDGDGTEEGHDGDGPESGDDGDGDPDDGDLVGVEEAEEEGAG